MPIEIGIWRIGKEPQRISFSSLESEEKLEDVLYKDISLLSPELMLIGRQVPTIHGTFIDLLAMDAEGNLSVIELKRHKTPREVVAQALDYSSWVKTLSYDDITELYTEKNDGKAFEQGFEESFGSNPPEKLNESLQIVIVAAELDSASERIISYLSDDFGVPINAVFFRYFKDGDNEYLTRTWLIDPHEVETKTSKSSGSKGKEPWNGNDYYVSFGDGEASGSRRDWDDAIKYGFVSAGGGKWYSKTLSKLQPGKRIFACIPGTGNVGVGIVTDTVKPVTEFMVSTDEGDKSILDMPLNAINMGKGKEDPDLSEYLVAVDWVKTLPREKAYWEKGMYANQNTVTKLRNRFTLEKLIHKFELEES